MRVCRPVASAASCDVSGDFGASLPLRFAPGSESRWTLEVPVRADDTDELYVLQLVSVVPHDARDTLVTAHLLAPLEAWLADAALQEDAQEAAQEAAHSNETERPSRRLALTLAIPGKRSWARVASRGDARDAPSAAAEQALTQCLVEQGVWALSRLCAMERCSGEPT